MAIHTSTKVKSHSRRGFKSESGSVDCGMCHHFVAHHRLLWL